LLASISGYWLDGHSLADGSVGTWTDRVQGFSVTEATHKPVAAGGVVTGNGTDQRLTSATHPLNGASEGVVVVVGSCPPWGASSPLLVDMGQSAGPRMAAYLDFTQGLSTYLAAPTSATVNAWVSGLLSMPAGIYAFPFNIADGATAAKAITKNGSAFGSRTASGAVSGTLSTGSGISLFADITGGRFCAASLEAVVLAPSASHVDEIVSLLRRIYGERSMRLPASAFLDTEPPADSGSYMMPSAFARVELDTTAETLWLAATDTIVAPYNTVGYSVDGGAKTVVSTSGGLVTLSPGSGGTVKRVVLELSGQSAPPATPNQGVYLDTEYGIGVPAGRAVVIAKPAVSRRLVAIGDSIFTGQAATTPQTGGCAMLTRANYPGRVTCVAAGYYSLARLSDTRYASIAALAAAVVSLCDGSTTNEVLIQVGTNDFAIGGASLWANVAAFRSALATLLAAIRAGTSAKIWLQTLGLRTDVATNDHSETPAQWRTAQLGALADAGVSNAASIDGTTLYTLAGSADGLHPSDAQQTAYGANLQTAMGF
jgi:lysophospholipase L1-like esterase